MDVLALILGGNTYTNCLIQTTQNLGGRYVDCAFGSSNDLTLLQDTTMIRCTMEQFTGVEPVMNIKYHASFSRKLRIDQLGCTKIVLKTATNSQDRAIISGGNIHMIELAADCTDGILYSSGVPVINNLGAMSVIERKYVPNILITGYVDGFVYYDSASSNTGSILGEDGVISNPVNNWVDAKAIADALNLKIKVKGLLTLTAGADGYRFEAETTGAGIDGPRDQVDMNGAFDYQNLYFENLNVYTDTLAQVKSSNVHNKCVIGDGVAKTLLAGAYMDCIWDMDNGVNYNELRGNTNIISGVHSGASDKLYISFAGSPSNTKLYVQKFSGEVTIRSMTNGSQFLQISGAHTTAIELDSTITNGLIELLGIYKLLDNKAGGFLIEKKGFIDANVIQWGGSSAIGNILNYITQSVYLGAIWYDAASGNANTDFGTDGTPDNPVNSLTAVLALMATLQTKKVMVRGSLACNNATVGYRFAAWDASGRIVGDTFGSNDWSDCIFENLTVTDNFVGNDETTFINCLIAELGGSSYGARGNFIDCRIGGNFVLGATFTTRLINCVADHINPAPTITFNNDHELVISNWMGELTIASMTTVNAKCFIAIKDGELTFPASNTNGTVRLEGEAKLTYQGAGQTVTNLLGLKNWASQDVLGSGASMIEDDGAGDKRWTAKALEEAPAVAGTVDANVVQWDGNGVTGDGDWATLVAGVAQIIIDIGNLNDISEPEVLAQVDAALDASNSALGGIPNVETGSLRQIIQLIGAIAKLGKNETLNLQTLFDEAGAPMGTRVIAINPGDVNVGKLT